MAQTGYTPISIYYSSTTTNVPTAGNLVAGELAINTADGKLFYKDSAGVVQTIASKAGALGDVVGPASATDNAVARFDATTGKLIQNSLVTVSDTGAISAPVDASISGLTVGKGNYAVASNTALGYVALATNSSGIRQTAVGSYALNATTSGTDNTAIGQYSLGTNTTGGYNTALGVQSLNSNTTASYNTAVGYQAGYSNTTSNNSLFGWKAGYALTGDYACFIGDNAGVAATTGRGNTFVGSGYANGAGSAVTTGGFNTILGAYTGNNGGLDIRTASNYIVLSDGGGNPRAYNNAGVWVNPRTTITTTANSYGGAGLNGAIDMRLSGACGRADWYNDASATNSCQYFYYNGVEKGSISITSAATLYNTTSDYRLKNVIGSVADSGQRLDALEPIEYEWKVGGRTRGFLAHKFAEVYPSSVSGEKDAVDEEGKPVYQAMQASSAEVIADLIAEIQSLRKRVATLEAK